jgi:hypothetical protein
LFSESFPFHWESPVLIVPENSTSGWFYFRGWLPDNDRSKF